MIDIRPKTVFLDIDGTLFYHHGTLHDQIGRDLDILPGVLEKFHEWDRKGYRIILVTGRRESSREVTERQLKFAGIFYDQLVMGVTGGVRVLINDLKEGSIESTAQAICVQRNCGIKDVEI